jgi:16S rRNA (guanine966-N2)-methyltransferase
VYCADAVAWLASAQARPFDLCFLDPPFRSALLAPALAALRARGWLAADALVYVETDKAAPLPESAAGWDWVRRKQAGQVCYGLLRPVAAPEPH